ncbi:Uma2 family endonuclease [Phormidium yuhuli AB48]|uniref:Uma2 family endonuclease n=2 Tax=Phormidium TaxID=1198 RepID=A0ABY5AQC0_9CYAN|nr:Uma2 family endonuclease [Phormidium yuhuli]USR91042.1 Uma2 family endonuclease [Phormidium yuhuli AB48]
MPKARHSRLQTKLLQGINALAKDAQLTYAFFELRCTFGDRSLVPDIAVFSWERIVFDASGEPVDDVQQAPDWVIEILSPQQSPNRVAGKLLHCL